ncbi:MAG: DUF362 domain-containing protein [Thermoplasmatota archaeon]
MGAVMTSFSEVAVTRNRDRRAAAREVVHHIEMPEVRGRQVLIKPNFNTADPAPGSTHMDTLRAVVEAVMEGDPAGVTVADRSGPTETREVFREKGVLELSEERGFDCLMFDEMPHSRYLRFLPPGGHWRNGFLFARPVLEADVVICLCCLKTHRYGGHFTMSLKLSTGMVHRENMRELHSSRHQRAMIAEMNLPYRPDMVIMDGVEAFTRGGPMRGEVWRADLTFASKDRVALDAAGVAALKMHGTTEEIESRRVFRQDQIARAVELGLGASSPDEMRVVPVDDRSGEIAWRISRVLSEG